MPKRLSLTLDRHDTAVIRYVMDKYDLNEQQAKRHIWECGKDWCDRVGEL